MSIFTAPFSAIAVSAAQDLWELLAPATTRVAIEEIRFGQYSDSGDAAAELLGVTFRVGDSTGGSGGSTITPLNLRRQPDGAAASTVVERNNTSQASGGSVIWADAWNIQSPFLYIPNGNHQRIVIYPNQRFVVALTAPADALTMNGTIVFSEIGLIS